MEAKDHASIINELMDREMIRDVLYRYVAGIDRCDEALLKSTYWPDASDRASDHHSDFKMSGEAFIKAILPVLKNEFVRTQHFLGNGLIRIRDATATVETYAHNWHTVRNAGGYLQDIVQGARYLDKFEKRNGEWRIANRLVVSDWFMENPRSMEFAYGVLGQQERRVIGSRYPDDPQYSHLGGFSPGGLFGRP